MNKMIKGALVTGVGVALLLGGGGTLAVWNVQQDSYAGTVAAGDLNLTSSEKSGVWTNSAGTTIDIDDYRVVPGETLTYTQDLTVTLVGDEMAADLAVTGAGVDNGFGDNVRVVTLVDGKTNTKLTPAEHPQTIEASVEFEFKESTSDRDSVNASYDFSGVGFVLEQIPPTAD